MKKLILFAMLLGLVTAQVAEAKVNERLQTKGGVELFVKDHGQGSVVIFTHGWPLNADMWDHHAHLLNENGFRTITYDKRGFGRSSKENVNCSYDVLADDLASVINASGAKKVTLVGYSMGGGEIVRYISKYGAKKVNKIILVATIVPGLLKTPDNPKGIEPAFFNGLKEGLKADRATFISNVIKDVIYDWKAKNTNSVTEEILTWSNYLSMQADFKALYDCIDTFGLSDLRKELKAVAVPTLILHGANDKPVPLEITGKDAAAKIQGAKLIVYEGASHGIVVTERDRVGKDILEFLKNSKL